MENPEPSATIAQKVKESMQSPAEQSVPAPDMPPEGKTDLSVVSRCRNELFGLSILGIIVFHFCESTLHAGKTDGFAVFSQIYDKIFSSSGVEIFLFLSGMGLFFSMKKNAHVGAFYKKRFRRVLIPYLLFGLVYWIIQDLVLLKTDIGRFFSDFLLITVWTDGVRRFWFISFILILYLVFPFFFWLFDTNRQHRKLIFLLTVAVWILLCALLGCLAPDVYNNIELAVCRFPAFLFGVYYGGKIYTHEPFRWPEKLLIVGGLLLRVVTFAVRMRWIPRLFRWNNRYETCLFAVALLFALALLLNRIRFQPLHKALAAVGKYSFELYITHVAIRSLMNTMGYPVSFLPHYLICIGTSVLLSLAIHALSERLLDGKKEKTTVRAA